MESDQHSSRSETGQLSLEGVFDRIRARFEVDTRSLAVFRIALGLIILVDLLHRAQHIELFYTDAGVFPRDVFEVVYPTYSDLSVHGLSGALWYQQVLFVVAGVVAVALILGYRTRLTTFVSLVLLLSLQGRNPAVLNGADRLFRVLLIVALVVPLGERWSIDALRRGSARTTVVSFGTVAVLLQPLAVFVSNAVLKHDGDTWYAGDALDIAFSNDVMTILLGDILAEYTSLLTVLTYGWVTLLAGSVLFLLVPVGRIRTLSTLVYLGTFTAMLVTMSVGLFPLLLAASVLPFLPGQFWDRLGGRVSIRSSLPDPKALGALDRPPVEQRLLASLQRRGYESVVSGAVTAAKLSLTAVGAAMVVWILLFSAYDVSDQSPPAELDNRLLTQQDWGLYTPDPSMGYSWYVTEATLENGSKIDALANGEPQFDSSPPASREYETFRHRKFFEKVRAAGWNEPVKPLARQYAVWACTQAQKHYSPSVENVTVYQLYKDISPDSEFSEPGQFELVSQNCTA